LEKKDVTWAKFGEQGGSGITAMLFLARNSCTEKAE
jgi:hypothetical protein